MTAWDPAARKQMEARAARNSLLASLELMVPLSRHRIRQETPETLQTLASEAASVISTTGDALLYGSKTEGTPGLTFRALATGIAAATLIHPDGIVAFGRHWTKNNPA